MTMRYEEDIKNRRVVITGASTGLGRFLTGVFVAAGARLAVCARNKEKLAVLARQYDSIGTELFYQGVDVTNSGQVSDFADAVRAKFGGVDVLIANAGVTDKQHSSLLDLPLETWNHVLTTNLTGTFYTLRAFLPILADSSGNAVVMSSLLGQKGHGKANDGPYCASKFGIEGLVEVASDEFRDLKVNINTIFPAEKVDTEFFSYLSQEDRTKLARPEVMIQPTLFLSTLQPGTLTKVSLNVRRWREDSAYRESIINRARLQKGDTYAESTDG